MGETALEFGPEWLRQLSHGSSTISPPPAPNIGMPVPVYSLAEFRYGREEMLAFFREDPKLPECLQEFPQLIFEKWQLPLALIPITEEEQRIWSRSVNSDAALRTSGKSGPGNGMSRTGRGGSVDRGRGRGRGGYYQRGLSFEDGDDGPPGGFSRPKPMERSQSANEKDQRWDDRDRRFDRTYSGRSGVLDDSNGLQKEGSRGPPDHWRKYDKEGGGEDWRSSTVRPSDKTGGRGSWRMNLERDRNNRDTVDRSLHNRSSHMNGMVRNPNHNPSKSSGGHSWDSETSGSNLPEWSVDESNETDIVGTFDSSGAFLEKKMAANASNEEIYISDDADEGNSKDSPEAKTTSTTTPKRPPPKQPQKSTNNSNIHPSRSPPKQNTAPSEQPTIHEETPSPEKRPSEIKKVEPCTHQPQNSAKKLDPVPENVILPGTVKPPVALGNSSNNKKNNKPPADCVPVTVPNVPDVAQKCTKNNSVVLSSAPPIVPETLEEDAFAHHKKATENMVAQWTEEEEHQVISQAADAFPLHQEDSNKWFYRDPQGEIQGPFTSPEMLEWFSAGYFTMGLMVRRGCDAVFSQLGELIKSWGRVPFMPGSSPPSIRVAPISANTTASSIPAPVSQTIVPSPVSAPTPTPQHLPIKQQQDNQLRLLQQQIMQQQIVQQQLLIRQAQMQTILGQLKQQDNFANLNPQQQQQILMQQYVAQQQHSRPNVGAMGDQKNILESIAPLTLPVLSLPIPPLLKNDHPLWNVAPGTAGTWPLGMNPTQTSGGSIWDTDLPKSAEESELKKQAQLLAEEQEKLRQAEELRLEEERQREEQRKQQEELKRKQEEERLLKELKKQEEEKKKQEELRRKQEEERQRQEELRRIEEQRRKEEELRRIEEQKRLEELHMQQEELRRQQQEERRRQEEEQRRKEELKRQEELQKQEELKRKEELRKKEEARLKEAQLMKELEREEMLKREREKQREREEMELRKIQELKIKAQCPAWGMQNSKEESIELSLSDIQRIQEEKDHQEREEKMRQQILQQQQQNAKQVQQSNNSLNWAKRSTGSPAVKSIAEIQQEEAENLAQMQQMQRVQKPQMPPPAVAANVGVWGNASHNRVTSVSQSWNTNYVATSGFWDDALNSTSARKPAKSNDSAFPALAINPAQPASANSNKNKNVRAKKEEDMVTRLFGTHRKPTDEFTQWCTEALSTLPSSVDVPTFVAFLKDVESPFEVYDYVKSYLGEGKEPREFAKQFLERRSKYRNQAKQMPAEENMWGPAPAITPLVNKPTVQHQHQLTNSDCDSSKGKAKKKKNRMQKLDNSMLGFTVQSNPDRVNAGEIDHIEGI